MTGIKPDKHALFDTYLRPLLDAVRQHFALELDDEKRAEFLAFPEAKQRAIVTPITVERLMEITQTDADATTYGGVLEAVAGDIWARSMELGLAIAESEVATRAGRLA